MHNCCAFTGFDMYAFIPLANIRSSSEAYAYAVNARMGMSVDNLLVELIS